ncbi:MAG: bifunctional [glutamate--ammonia ligase]-adenylyl-L-tyrosine phosphorylase/[glutamate--ammonia-ligase] adenylyltransferase [Gammaproteobacteria bacterium]|nr:bifunctional [glutamate--ammonia ligase]-adenylyl-L-tyrosine phosphorylase/[glutamate--ammonia-ligase] adenylyltransferase [Gammaproteobacteria bacterium]
MENNVARHIADLPELLRPPVALWFERLSEQNAGLPDEFIAPVVRLVACSEFAARVLLREFSWFIEHIESFAGAPGNELEDFVAAVCRSDADIPEVQAKLRRFRHRYLLRILWREVQGLADLDETLGQLSLLADRLLDAATRHAEKQLQPRFGQVRNASGGLVPLVILGMGKLGGHELNFSSDIDLIFCYSENGQSDGDRELSAEEYFGRLCRQIIALIDDTTVDGFVFRIDTRLRPFGESGPPVVSFSALESYLLKHGRDWERYAYIKARIVGPMPPAEVADELNDKLIRPFVYRRYLDFGVFESVREMQQMIAAEVRRRELAGNVKLGPGGIREAEFIVQALQLVRGGSEPALQCRELQKVLPLLVSERGISVEDAEKIRSSYRYLRRLENFIQALRDQQTHELPVSAMDRERLCLAMNYNSWGELLVDLNRHRNAISAQFEAIAIRGKSSETSATEGFSRLWESRAGIEEWADALGGDSAAELAQSIVAFASSSQVQIIDSVSDGRLQRYLPKLVELAAASKHPLMAMSRALAVTEKILRRSAYLALLNENPNALSRLVDLCARSQYIADQIARYPVLLDELLDPGVYSNGVTKADLAAELRRRSGDTIAADSEARMQVIAQFQRAAMFRIAVADFNDQLPIMKVSDALTWLAEVVLEEALHVAWADLTERHGVPSYVVGGVVHEAGFGIVGYGKLGGLELSYGSDLDVVFLHDSKGEKQQTDGDKALDNTMFFSRLVRRLVHLLTTQTGSGELYEIDTRLRPDGRSGLLVSSVEAFERYQEENAWTWEHQALLRARAVAGSEKIKQTFERIRHETLCKRVRRDQLRDDVIAMRHRMRKELDSSDDSRFDLKHGAGGIGDIEFLVQYLVLREASTHPDVIFYSDNIRQLDALVAVGMLERAVGNRLQDIYRDYRLRVHHRVLDGQKALCDADDFMPERNFVSSAWKEWLG